MTRSLHVGSEACSAGTAFARRTILLRTVGTWDIRVDEIHNEGLLLGQMQQFPFAQKGPVWMPNVYFWPSGLQAWEVVDLNKHEIANPIS